MKNDASSTSERRYYTPVQPETLDYFKNIEQILDDPERFADGDNEAKELFINNVYNEINGKEKVLPMDYDCSRILERIFKQSSDFHLRVFFDKLAGSYVELSGHRFGSHVVQTMLSLSSSMVEREMSSSDVTVSDESGGVLLPMKDLVIRYCQEIEPSFIHMLVDQYASHVIRTLISVLSGIPIKDSSLVRSKSSAKYSASFDSDNASKSSRKFSVPSEFLDHHKNLIKLFMKETAPEIMNDYVFHPLVNPVLQVILESVHEKTQLATQMISAILQRSFAVNAKASSRPELISDMLRHPVGSHLLEKILAVAPADIYFTLYNENFRHRLLTLTNHQLSNFVVQQLLTSASDPIHAQLLVDEVLSHFGKYLVHGKTGWNVLMKAAELCQKFKVSQKEFVKALFKEFNATDNQRRHLMVKLVLSMCSFENYSPEASQFSTFGASLLSHLYQFEEAVTVPLLESMMSVSVEEIVAWSTDPSASRAVEGFLLGNSDARAKLRFIQRLKGHFHELALDKFGGHVVDKCWMVSDIKLKESIAEELMQHERSLKDNFYGKFILRNCRIDQYKRKKGDWVDKEKRAETTKALFADILDDHQGGKNGEKMDNGNGKVERIVSEAETKAMKLLGFGVDSGRSEKVTAKEKVPSKEKKEKSKKSKKSKFTESSKKQREKRKKEASDSEEEDDDLNSLLMLDVDSDDNMDVSDKNSNPTAPTKKEQENHQVITKQSTEVQSNSMTGKKIPKDLSVILGAIGAVNSKKTKDKKKQEAETKASSKELKQKRSKQEKTDEKKRKRQFAS